MVTVLRIPLIVTVASLHAIVLLFSMPDTVSDSPGAPAIAVGSACGAPGGAGIVGTSIDGNVGMSIEPSPLDTLESFESVTPDTSW